LGVSPATLARRVLPLIETIEMPWGTQLIPVDELERLVAERRRPPRPRQRTRAVGRRPTLPDDVARRIVAGLFTVESGEHSGEVAGEAIDGRTPRPSGSRVAPRRHAAVLATLPAREDRVPDRPVFPGLTQERLRTAIARAARASGTPAWSHTICAIGGSVSGIGRARHGPSSARGSVSARSP
jgi:hypothetical protein